MDVVLDRVAHSTGLNRSYQASKSVLSPKTCHRKTKSLTDITNQLIHFLSDVSHVRIHQNFKCVFKQYHIPQDGKMDERRSRILREGPILQRMCHNNIVEYVYHFVQLPTVIVVTKWFHGCDIIELMKDLSPVDDVFTILNITKQMVSAVHYCHCIGIAHCDIKPDNFILNKCGTVKLIDFGTSYECPCTPNLVLDNCKHVSNFCLKGSHPIVGTEFFTAPEVVKKRYNPFAADVYSLGKTLMVLFTQNCVTTVFHYIEGLPTLFPLLDEKANFLLESMLWIMVDDVPHLRPTLLKIKRYLMSVLEYIKKLQSH